MARLEPLNPATCTKCRSKKTERIGYSESRKGSLWKCENDHVFVVPMLVLAAVPKKTA